MCTGVRECGRVLHTNVKSFPAPIYFTQSFQWVRPHFGPTMASFGWKSYSQSSKNLKGTVVKAGDIGLGSGGGGRAPGCARVDGVQCMVLPSKRQEAARTIAEQKALLPLQCLQQVAA